jgi:surface carbohydrate biosynthesis protein
MVIEKQIVIPIETKVREFQGKLLCSLVLAERGYRVILGEQNRLLRALEDYTPCICIHKSFAATQRKAYSRCLSLGGRLAAWDEEGLVYFDAETYVDLRLDADCLKMLDAVFAWGPDQARIIRDFLPEGPLVIETGNPRLDMLRPELRGYYNPVVDHLRARHGRIILVNTAFPLSNHFHSDLQIARMSQQYPITKRRPDFFKSWEQAQAEGMLGFEEMVPELCRSFPDHTVIVRPHPSEDRHKWEALVSLFDNALVNAEGNVVEWILASDCVLHFDCTSGLEAFLLGIPAIVYRRHKSEGYEQKLPNSLSYRAETHEQALELVGKAIKGSLAKLKDDPDRLAILRRHVTGAYENLASDRIADALDELALIQATQPRIEQVDLVRSAWRWWLKRYRRLMLKRSSYAQQKFSDLSIREIEEAIQRMANCLSRFSSVRLRQMDESVFMIEQ